MKTRILSLSIVILWASLGYGFIPMPLDSPVVVNNGETGGNWSRSTARDSHGWIYAVYVSGSTNLVCCSRSTDEGQTWSLIAVLNDAWGISPNIVIDKGDSIYVDWEREDVDTLGWDIYFSKYNGVSWTSQVNVSNQHVQGTTESSSIAVDGRGVPHLTWLGAGLNVWYSDYTNNVWSAPVAVTPGGQWDASMCADTGTNLHLAWQGWQIQYKEYSGGVWGPAEQASPKQGYAPSIATDLECRSHVAYDDSLIHIAYIRRDSAGWSIPYPVSDTIGRSPSITCDKYGHLYVVWVGYESKEKLWYATYDGTSWSTPVRLRNDTAYGDFSPRLGFPVSDSGIDLIWTMNNPSGSGYRVMYWRLPLLPVGVEGQTQKALNVERVSLNVQNPTRRELNVSYSLPSQSKISLILYDLSGRKVALVDEGERVAGKHEVNHPLNLSSGVYLLRLESGKVSLTRKVVLIR